MPTLSHTGQPSWNGLTACKDIWVEYIAALLIKREKNLLKYESEARH